MKFIVEYTNGQLGSLPIQKTVECDLVKYNEHSNTFNFVRNLMFVVRNDKVVGQLTSLTYPDVPIFVVHAPNLLCYYEQPSP